MDEEDGKYKKPPSGCQLVENSFPVFLSLMFCIVLLCHVFSIFISTIMGQLRWKRRHVVKCQDCKFSSRPKYIFFFLSEIRGTTVELNLTS